MMDCDGPALLSPFTLTLTLSHQGRGDFAAAWLSSIKGEGIIWRFACASFVCEGGYAASSQICSSIQFVFPQRRHELSCKFTQCRK